MFYQLWAAQPGRQVWDGWQHAKRAIVAVLAVSLLLWTPGVPASASAACYGCNVVDEGTFNSSLIGSTVYFRKDGNKTPVTVLDVNTWTKQLRWQTSNGATGWNDAADFYTSGSSDERDVAIGGSLILGAACLLFCPTDSSSSSSQADDREDQHQQCLRKCDNSAPTMQGDALRDQCIKQCDARY